MLTQKDYQQYEDNLNEIHSIVYDDLNSATSENDYIESNLFKNAYHSPSEKCNIITRYFEDNEYARAYAVKACSGGIMILFNKTTELYNIITLGEDDGSWFPTEYYEGFSTTKSDFIYLLTEALGTFNNYYHDT